VAIPRAKWAEVGGFRDEVVKERTGRSWEEWVRELDASGARKMTHGEIAQLVSAQGVGGWWSQGVTVGYERIVGLRDVNQRRAGGYEASRSRTFDADAGTLYAMFADGRRRKRWLPEGFARVRTATEPKSLRVDWSDGTQLHVWITPKGPNRATVAVTQVKLPEKAGVERAKAFWGERFDALADALG
jgi:hypothetical protein